jgi:hypothetical protein
MMNMLLACHCQLSPMLGSHTHTSQLQKNAAARQLFAEWLPSGKSAAQ